MLSLVDILSNTLITLQNATGKIRNYQLVVGGILLLNFPLSYVCLKVGFAPESTYIVAIVVAVMCMISRLLFLRRSASLPMSGFLKRVVLNVAMVLICSMMVPLVIHKLMPYGWERFLVVGVASVIMSAVSVLFVGCNRSERSFIIQKALSVKDKFRR